MMQEKEVMQLLEETQAVLHGHFLLTSGLHSPMYVEKIQCAAASQIYGNALPGTGRTLCSR